MTSDTFEIKQRSANDPIALLTIRRSHPLARLFSNKLGARLLIALGIRRLG